LNLVRAIAKHALPPIAEHAYP